MYKYICLSIAVLLITPITGFACDSCGSAISGGGISLLGNYRTNTIGLSWSHAPFSSTLEYGNDSQDQFTNLELFLRWQPLNRLKFMIRQPYRWNYRTGGHGIEQKLNGLGDVEMTAYFAPLDNQLIGKTLLVYWEVGGGIKLPSGAYESNLEDGELPENFNLGNGSIGYIVQSNLVVSRFNWGITGSFRYQWNVQTTEGYDFGNQLTANAMLFYQFNNFKNWQITPLVGRAFEKIALDVLPQGNISPRTGGKGHFLLFGTNFRLKDAWQLGVTHQLPLANSYSNEEVVAKGRWAIEWSFSF